MAASCQLSWPTFLKQLLATPAASQWRSSDFDPCKSPGVPLTQELTRLPKRLSG